MSSTITSADTPDSVVASPSLARCLPAWGLFWLLMFVLAVQDHWRQGQHDLWRPLLWEGSSCLVASAIAGWQWRRAAGQDAQLTATWRWFTAALVWLPLAAVGFVAAVYSMRHAVHALVGIAYQHGPWRDVFLYESLKFAIFYLLFAAIIFGIRSHATLGATRLRVERERALSQEAQLLQLAQQLEPHFLFNALNTVASTIHTDPDLADSLLVQLAALLRAATDLTRQPEVTLDDELRLLQAYGEIMLQRFAERVSLRFDIDDAARSCRLPTLALQPLLENAFRHGVARTSAPVAIVISARCRTDRLELAVQDDAGVLEPDLNLGVGLSNLRQRLAVRYGEQARLTLSARAGGGVLACLELPCAC
jgi:two-component system, LytTR family, sensor kinase